MGFTLILVTARIPPLYLRAKTVVLAIHSHLPVLQVIVPMILAFLVLLVRNGTAAWVMTLLATLGSLAISSTLFCNAYTVAYADCVPGTNYISYAVGGWQAPYGIELRVTLFNSTILSLVSFVAFVTTLSSYHLNKQEITATSLTKFYALFLLTLSGFMGIIVTNDAFNLYVFLEISSLSSYALVAMGRTRESLLAAFNYLINGTIGATFYLIGLGLIYSVTGTLNISDLAYRIQELLPVNGAAQVGALFILVGLMIKMALFPFHSWLVKAYSTAPSFVTTFFSGTATKVMIYVFLHMTYRMFGHHFVFTTLPWNYVIVTLASLAIIVTGIGAILQKDPRKIFAYSSISQIGYIILAVGLDSRLALTAAIIHIINHCIIKSGIFMVFGAVSYSFNSHVALAGLFHTLPKISIFLTILLASLVGIPVTAGFISKWYIVDAIIQSQNWVVLSVFAVGSFLSAIYSWKIIELMYRHKPVEMEHTEVHPIVTACIAVMVAITITSGLYIAPVVGVASKMAELYFPYMEGE